MYNQTTATPCVRIGLTAVVVLVWCLLSLTRKMAASLPPLLPPLLYTQTDTTDAENLGALTLLPPSYPVGGGGGGRSIRVVSFGIAQTHRGAGFKPQTQERWHKHTLFSGHPFLSSTLPTVCGGGGGGGPL